MALSTAYKAIIDGLHTNHVIYIKVLDQDEVKNILAGEKYYKAYQMKTAVLSFQECPVGTFPCVIICGRLQSNNKAKDFNDTVVKSCTEF